MYEFERVTPESVGISTDAVMRFLDALEADGIEMHSMMLMRHDKVYAQGWWAPYESEIPHIMFSFSKSFTSTAIGFAVQEGIISLDDKLVDLFPDETPENPSENLKKATVRHLLMMGCGHEKEIEKLGDSANWIKDFMHNEFKYEPGTHFLYNTAGTNMLCAILKKKSGENLTAFLRPRLFDPLGISDVKCSEIAGGIEAGGFGYKMRTEDMARFIKFVSHKGNWEGKQLLNSEWFDMATSKQIDNSKGELNPMKDWIQGYGFQFWRCSPEGVFRGDGAFGQYGVVMPNEDATFVITSSSIGMHRVIENFWDIILPEMKNEKLAENKEANLILDYRLKNLSLPKMLSMRQLQKEEELVKCTLVAKDELPSFTDMVMGTGRFMVDGGILKSLKFELRDNDLFLICEEDVKSYEINLGYRGKFARTDIDGVPYAANVRWRAENALEFEVRNLTTASGTRFIFRFLENEVKVEIDGTLPQSGGIADEEKKEFTLYYE